jgi:hypothetical protein
MRIRTIIDSLLSNASRMPRHRCTCTAGRDHLYPGRRACRAGRPGSGGAGGLDLGKLVLGSGQADLESLDLAESAFSLDLGHPVA